MLNKLKEFIKKSDRLYVIARCIKNINDPNYRKLVKGYYEVSDSASILIEHKGEKYPDKIIYHIGFWQPNNTKKDGAGFCALLRWSLLSMSFSDALGLAPVVEWSSNSVYYDPSMDSVTLNVFEYYFEPVSQICSKEIENCKNVINAIGVNNNMVNSLFFMERASDMFASYNVEQEEIERLAYLYKKYIHLNNNTQKYIEEQIDGILNTEPILAVHIRGTDFNVGFKDHPIAVTAEQYLETVKQVYASGNYKKIFLATDDANALELFKEEFKDKLLYYKDVIRSANHNGVHATFSDRPLHHYKLGLEILRDIYTLASCDSLICGLSQVAFAARYVNLAIDRKFDDVVVLNNGINKMDSKKAQKLRLESRKGTRNN